MVALDGYIDWIITSDLDQTVNRFVVEPGADALKNDNRWQVEDFHRGFKRLTGAEKCQCRKSRSQRNHLACCYHAWVSLKVQAKQIGTTIYQIKHEQLSDYLVNQLYYPTIPAL